MNQLPKNSKIIFETIVGSQAYNLHTKDSDIDRKGLFLQSNDDIMSNGYIPQVDIDADTVYYELRRFLELVSVGNPNVLELLFVPDRCILKQSKEWMVIWVQRHEFLSKKCYNTYYNYATGQLKKSRGLKKKINWDKEKTERKDILDFCKMVDRESGIKSNLKDWLEEKEYTQDHVGLTQIKGFRDSYKLYTDDIKWVNENPRFEGAIKENRNYRGIMKDNSNEPRLSTIEKYLKNDWKGVMYWNREQYSIHCKNYLEYQKWLRNRNEKRYTTNRKHGQDFDSKFILHLVRLIMTGREIPIENTINVDRTDDREYLLSIKRGEIDLSEVVDTWTTKANEMKELYDNSVLKEEVDLELIRNIELEIRKQQL